MSFRADISPAFKAFTWFVANNNVMRKKNPRAWESRKRDILCLCLVVFEPERKREKPKKMLEKKGGEVAMIYDW